MEISADEQARLTADWGGPPAESLGVSVAGTVEPAVPAFRALDRAQRSSWQSIEEVMAAVRAAYPPDTTAVEMTVRSGVLLRRVERYSGNPPTEAEDGILEDEIYLEWIPVALSKDAAVAASARRIVLRRSCRAHSPSSIAAI